MSISEFVDNKIGDDQCLYYEKRLLFTPSWNNLVICSYTNDHVYGHQRCLEDNPALLDTIADGIFIVVMIEFVRRNPILVHNCQIFDDFCLICYSYIFGVHIVYC